jgi:hypothetical protein
MGNGERKVQWRPWSEHLRGGKPDSYLIEFGTEYERSAAIKESISEF